MKIAISAQGANLDAQTSDVFGRAPTLIFVDTETGVFEALANPAMAQGGGAGTLAAQFVLRRGAAAILSGTFGPNAVEVFEAAGVPAYQTPQGTVRQAIDMFKSHRLRRVEKPGRAFSPNR
jgi:predicted Fe-Mo cluster-binding NifX family protein